MIGATPRIGGVGARRCFARRRAALSRNGEDRGHDRLIARAPAKMSGKHVANLRFVGLDDGIEEIDGGKEDPRRAKAALQRKMFVERLLQPRQSPVGFQPLDGHDVRSFHLNGIEQA